MPKNEKKKVKLHIKWKALFLFLVLIISLSSLFFYYYNLSVKHIYIKGTTEILDYEIIEASGLKNYPKLNKLNSNTIEKNIKNIPLVDSVKVTKDIFGKVTIAIKEAYPLFYNCNTENYVLSNGLETDKSSFLGVPFLVNYVPSDIYERLIKDLNKVKKESLALISEMYYNPSMSGDILIDNTRFLLKMNDGNQVHINLIHIDRLDIYDLTYTTIPVGEKGMLEMDSDNDRGYWHKIEETSDVPEDNKDSDDSTSDNNSTPPEN